MCALWGENKVSSNEFWINSSNHGTRYKLTNYKLLCCFKECWKCDFASQEDALLYSVCDQGNRENNRFYTAYTLEATMTGESPQKHKNHGPVWTHPTSHLYIISDVSVAQSFNTLRPRQNCLHFPDDIFKCIFMNENVQISIPKGPINNITVLVQIMAWRRPGEKPLSEPMMVSLLTHICVSRPQWVNTKHCSIICKCS